MWDYLYMFFISGEVAPCETSDCVIESRAADITYSQGYVVESYYTSIRLNIIYS